ncbi:hypothetical protein MSAN_02059400 [Mycena sanguinolenta]|uniref:Uncharacterized protein n=1 Tax=Mycena sanguinolenta TaxID=230812 RepID=A0A8H7CL40_9AGAR|nr:hypothetical protein MSAN_02059400 [Mycena sanguinolenta]
MANDNLQTATLVSLFVESILYGLFILLFVLSMSILLGKKKQGMRINKPMVSASIIMFILSTVHLGIDLRRAMNTFLNGKSIAAVNTTSYILKSSVYYLQTITGDGFMLFRVYLVWNGDNRVCVPIFVCFLTSVATGIVTINEFAQVSSSDPVFVKPHNWIVSFFSLTLFTNFSCTSLIAGRIWWINHKAGRAARIISGRKLGPTIIIIIESGAIYSACLIILLSLYVSGSYAQYIALDGVVQVVGVVFSLVIVRIGLGLTSEATTHGRASPFNAASATATPTVGNVELGRLGAISISTTVEVKQDELSEYEVNKGGTNCTSPWPTQLDV